jgi:hypothetical protein
MNTLKHLHSFSLALSLLLLSSIASAQESSNSAPTPLMPKATVVEVMYYKGSNLAYQAIDSWTWYGAFKRTSSFRSGTDEIQAVKIVLRPQDGGNVKARVSVLRGKNMDNEDFVGEAIISPGQKIVTRELWNLGIEPFELQIVRAPSTVADLPTVVNKTKSLQVSVAPNQSTIPSFVARVLNNSPKPVAAFSYFTSVEGKRALSGTPRNQTGTILIQPGDTYQLTLRYATKPSSVSTGEMPQAQQNLVFNVTSVVFTDGNYEGDTVQVAIFLAIRLGEKAQLRSFLDRIRANGPLTSESDVEAAVSAINIDALAAEIINKFPELSPTEKTQISGLVDLGQSLGVKFFRTVSGNPTNSIAELLQARIDGLP